MKDLGIWYCLLAVAGWLIALTIAITSAILGYNEIATKALIVVLCIASSIIGFIIALIAVER